MSKPKHAMTRKERIEMRRAQELKRRMLEKEAEETEEIIDIDENDEEVDDEAVSEVEEEAEDVQKDMGMDASTPAPYVGPVSFDELDQAEAEREKAREVSELGWKVQDLVWNIVHHPEMDAKARGEAIKQVGEDFKVRVEDCTTGDGEEMTKDLDALSAQSILAHDKRHSNFFEGLLDKAVLSTSARKKLDSSQFALPEKRKYPIHDKAHVRNALSRAAQQIAEGGAGAADAKAAMPRIRAAAKRFGIEVSMKKDRNAIVVEKDAQGNWRWVGWVTNNFEDTDEEIISKEAHQEYVSFLDRTPQMVPAFITWHTPDTAREALPDWWAFENGFLMMSGKLTEKEARSLLEAESITDLGMSHGTLVLARDPSNPKIITKYRMYEVSDLPLENAANPFTALETLSKEADMDKAVYLAKFVGKERAEELLAQTAVAQKELTEAGIASKETQAPPETPPAQTQVPAPVLDDLMVKELVAKITEQLDIPGLNEFVLKAQDAMEKVPLLEKALKELTTNEDDRLAEKIAPPALSLAWSMKNRASESEATIPPEGDKIVEQTPGLDDENWLSRATGSKPIAV